MASRYFCLEFALKNRGPFCVQVSSTISTSADEDKRQLLGGGGGGMRGEVRAARLERRSELFSDARIVLRV